MQPLSIQAVKALADFIMRKVLAARYGSFTTVHGFNEAPFPSKYRATTFIRGHDEDDLLPRSRLR